MVIAGDDFEHMQLSQKDEGDDMTDEEMRLDMEEEMSAPVEETAAPSQKVSFASASQPVPDTSARPDLDSQPRWYVAHTYSGYENKVKANIEKTIENRHLEDEILEVRVPIQEVMEMKNDKKRLVQRKMFPGYVLINMVMNDDTWYVVRNTRGVTGFVGPGSKPVPLTELEMFNLGVQSTNIEVSFKVGDKVKVASGPWADTISDVTAINAKKQTVTIMVEMLGREVPMDVSFGDIRKL